jgi:hypothetical protein
MDTLWPWMPTTEFEPQNFLIGAGMLGVVQGVTFGPMSGGGHKKKVVFNLTGGGVNLTGGGTQLTGKA